MAAISDVVAQISCDNNNRNIHVETSGRNKAEGSVNKSSGPKNGGRENIIRGTGEGSHVNNERGLNPFLSVGLPTI